MAGGSGIPMQPSAPAAMIAPPQGQMSNPLPTGQSPQMATPRPQPAANVSVAPSNAKGGGTPQPPNMFTQSANAINQAMAGSAQEMGYQPMQVGYGRYNPMMVDQAVSQPSRVGTRQVGMAQVNQGGIEKYFNPYTNQVIDASLQDIERARLMQQNQAAAQAQAAGAFGGSRGALMESEIGRNALEQAAQTAAQLRSQGFTEAANLAQQDANRALQAMQANAANALQASLANQQAGLTADQYALQAALANQAARSGAMEFGLNQMQTANLANQAAMLAGSGQRLLAGQQLANIGNLGFGQAQDVQQNMQQQGLMQQALQQQLIDAARGQFQGYAGFPQQSLGYYTQALGASQIPQSQTTTSDPGAFGWLSMLLGSDVQFKENITPVGQTKGGHNLYMWDWNETAKDVLGETGSSMGVLAQEVMQTNPELVVRGDHGYLMVNYGGIH